MSANNRDRLDGRVVREWIAWFFVLGLATGAMLSVREKLNEAHVTLAYLFVVQVGSARGGRPLGIALAAAAFLCFDFFFLAPYGTLTIQNPLDWLVLAAFLGTSVLSAQLLYRAQQEAASARQRAIEIDRLAALGAETLNVGRAEEALTAIVGVIRTTLGIDDCAVYTRDPVRPERRVVARTADAAELAEPSDRLIDWVATNGTSAGEWADGTTRLDVAPQALGGVDAAGPLRAYLRPLQVRGSTVGVLRIAKSDGISLGPAEIRVLDALAYYAALAVERVRLAAAAERATALQEAHRAKDAVLASVSHDLRTPLTTIKGLASEIADSGDERAATIEDEVDRLTHFVAQLLDLSRINSGAAVSDVQPNEAEDLLGAAAQRVAGRLDDHELRLSVEKDGALLFGRFDFSETLRALVNLIENAAKYSPAGAPIDVSAKRDGPWLVFSVGDRGAGVPAVERERIFEPFYRRLGRAPDAGGAGLGLAISRGIAEAQGGSVRVEDRDGGGTVFGLFVPAMSDLELSPSAEAAAENS